MKINTVNVNRVEAIQGTVQAPQKVTPTLLAPQDQVTISAPAQFISDLREATGDMTNIRSDVVQQARMDIQTGQIGTPQDYDRAIDALMMEL